MMQKLLTAGHEQKNLDEYLEETKMFAE